MSDVFARMGAKRGSFDEYAQAADQRKLNALALDTGRLNYGNALQAAQDDALYRDAVKSFGADANENVNKLRGLGLGKQAMAYEQAALDAKKKQADTYQSTAAGQASEAGAAKSRFEVAQAKIGTGMKILQAGTSPQAVLQLLQQSVQAGLVTPEEAQRNVSDMPQDPAGFAKWRDGQLMQGVDMAKRLELQRQAAEQEERIRHNKATEGLTAAQQRQQMTIAQMNDARMRENAAITREASANLREDKAAAKKVENVDKEVTKFAGALQKEGIPDIEAALSGAESIFKKYADPKTGKATNVPGVGRITNVLPDWAVSDEGKDVRSSLAAVSNIVLSARSGAAVTDQELRRLARELQLSLGGDAAGMQSAYAKFRDRFEAVKSNLSAGVSDDVKSVYEDRGGIKIQRGGAKPAASPAADPVAAALEKYK